MSSNVRIGMRFLREDIIAIIDNGINRDLICKEKIQRKLKLSKFSFSKFPNVGFIKVNIKHFLFYTITKSTFAIIIFSKTSIFTYIQKVKYSNFEQRSYANFDNLYANKQS